MKKSGKLKEIGNLINTLNEYSGNLFYFDLGEYLKMSENNLDSEITSLKRLLVNTRLIISKPVICKQFDCKYNNYKNKSCDRKLGQYCPKTVLPGNKLVIAHKKNKRYLKWGN